MGRRRITEMRREEEQNVKLEQRIEVEVDRGAHPGGGMERKGATKT